MKKSSYFSGDIAEFLFLLAKHNVRYLIVGGEAVIYYGYARLTGDIDLYYQTTRRNVRSLFDTLNEFWNNDIPGREKEEELMQQGMIFQFGVPPNRIDLISVFEGFDFEEVWKNRKSTIISYKNKRFRIHYVGLNELIENKKAVGRAKDIDDLRFLLKAKRKVRK